MHSPRFTLAASFLFLAALTAAAQSNASKQTVPRTPDGKPDLQGIWQASGSANADLQDHSAEGVNMPAGRSVVVGGGAIPYQPWALQKKAENFKNRQAADPFGKCYIPGVPRVMYIDFPFQIFQTPSAIAMAFEWELDYRLIHMDGRPHPEELDFWMGDSRGHWEGDTLVVDVANNNGNTWLDKAGDFHSDAFRVSERYHMTGPDTIQYEATMQDSKVYTKPWTINIVLHRRTDRNRLYEYNCESQKEEADGDFTREDRTWYPGNASAPLAKLAPSPYVAEKFPPVAGLKRTADGKPDLQGFYETQSGGANQGLERRLGGGRGGRGGAARNLIVDPPDGKLPMLPWAAAERASRRTSERGYDDPTAHCFPAGMPRSYWVPQGIQVVQTPQYVVFLFERTAWRIVPLDGRAHLPEDMRLWQGDAVGHWEGDTLVIDTTNFNGKTWLNEAGEVISYAEHLVERITPTGPDTFNYEATVSDPVVYSKPWTVEFPMRREPKFELIEAACHEEDQDLPHLKALKDAAAKKK